MLIDSESRKKVHAPSKPPSGPRIPIPARPLDRGGVPPTLIIATPPAEPVQKPNTEKTATIDSAERWFKAEEDRAAAAAVALRVLQDPAAKAAVPKDALDPTPPVRKPSPHSLAKEIRAWTPDEAPPTPASPSRDDDALGDLASELEF